MKKYLLLALALTLALSLAAFAACNKPSTADNSANSVTEQSKTEQSADAPVSSAQSEVSASAPAPQTSVETGDSSTYSPTSADNSTEPTSAVDSAASSTETSVPVEPGKKVTVTFDTGTSDLTIAPQTITEGASVKKPDAVRNGFVVRRWMYGNSEFDFSSAITSDITLKAEWVEQTNLPTLIIELYNDAGGVYNIADVDKENYVTSKMTLANPDGSFELNDALSNFKGRGNGSWSQGNNKNGYKIKLDKKQGLFGRASNKHWVILACTNFGDDTMLHNYTAFNLANEVFDNIEYSTNAVWIDVYINGDYRGVYILCEHVRVAGGRVDIKSEYGVENTGYLLEYDAYAENNMFDNMGGKGGGGSSTTTKTVEGIDFFKIDYKDEKGNTVKMVKYPFTVHSPDPEEYESDGKITEEAYRAQIAYIQDYVTRAYKAAIVDHDFETLCELVDIDSLVDVYILQELYENTDCGYSSFYLYKKPNGKLYFGPPWDFDGTTTVARNSDANKIYIAEKVMNNGQGGNGTDNELFYELYHNVPEFLPLVKARWNELSSKIQAYYDNLFTEEFYAENKYALGRNFERWSSGGGGGGKGGGGGGGGATNTQTQKENNWVSACNTLKKWFDDRIKFLNNEWKL